MNRNAGDNVAYLATDTSDHGIVYSREAFRQMSRLAAADRRRIKEALMAMRTDDELDERLTATRRVRRIAEGLRFVFERNGSALTVLAIAGGGSAERKDRHS